MKAFSSRDSEMLGFSPKKSFTWAFQPKGDMPDMYNKLPVSSLTESNFKIKLLLYLVVHWQSLRENLGTCAQPKENFCGLWPLMRCIQFFLKTKIAAKDLLYPYHIPNNAHSPFRTYVDVSPSVPLSCKFNYNIKSWLCRIIYFYNYWLWLKL